VSREADGWYVSISCSEVPTQPLPPTGQETGIDLGIEAFASLATGERIFSPRFYRRAERALAKCQQRVSKRVRGSHRRRKATCWLAKAHQHVRRQRQDFHHKTALALVRQYDVIYYENLRVANMVRNQHLAKSISDAGWRRFLAILSFKAASAGREVVAVTLPTAEAGGFSSPAIRQTSYLPGVHRNYGAPLRVASLLAASKRTAHVLPAGRLSSGTPRTRATAAFR
jgi:putative transposase